MTPLLALLSLGAAVDAPITQVTVFTDQARVVRTTSVAVGANTVIEFPPLRDTVDVSSVRVESTGAEVKRVDIERIAPEKLRTEPAKKLLAEIDKLDTELERLSLERATTQQQLDALHRLSPSAPQGDPLKAPPKLNAAGWQAATQFAPDQLLKAQARLRDLERAQKKANESRNKLVEDARKLGNPQTTSGWKVTAQASGGGNAIFTLTYLVRNAQWTPTWDLQLNPDTNTVSLSLAGLVSQSTGEDWNQATLLLSTAIPSHAVKVPRLATWKIGVADRFIPTPTPMYATIAPAPAVPNFGRVRTEEDLVRARLQQLGVNMIPASTTTGVLGGVNGNRVVLNQPGYINDKRTTQYDFEDDTIDGDLVKPDGEYLESRRMRAPAAPPPPPAQPARDFQAAGESVTVASVDEESSYDQAPKQSAALGMAFGRSEQAPVPVATFSLSPPPAWRPPVFGPDSPVTLAAGYDLSFVSLQKETVPSAGGTRRVALWAAQWPVTVERKLFPALTTDSFLVAELKNPSQQVLPGGPAQLYVGADPAGTARLKLVSPGESFTLPLGIDRALKPVRNVQLVEAEKGVFSKDEIGTYVVTIELANPYRAPIAVRVLDQFPVTDQKDLETKLLETKPTATQDAKKGSLEWRVTIPAQSKQTFSFTYTLKRPKGWKLQQQEVVR
ncbi:MAG: mucoidy inhibitor MuiA family protein [Archangium sp.]